MSTGPPAGHPARWSLGLPFFGFAAGLVVALMAESFWISAHHGDTNSLGVVVCSAVGLWVGLGGSALYASRTQGTGRLQTDFGLRFGPFDPLLGGPIGVAAQYVLGLLVVVAYQASGVSQKTINNLGQPARQVTGLAHGWGDVILVLVVVIGAPVVEELFFRGLLLRALQARFGSAPAVVVSGLLFGLAHFEPLQLPVLAGFGIVLGVVALRTGRLGPGICAHAAFNALAVYSILSSR